MKKLFMVLLACLFVSGCAMTNESVPGASIPFAEANYEISGDTSAEECSPRIIGLHWRYLFGADTGGISSGALGIAIPPLLGGPSAVAVRKALDKVPGATHALATRTTTSAKGIPFLYSYECANVRTRGVTMGKPLPN